MALTLDPELILFAKTPIPGLVKTRLTTHCTNQEAAKIAETMTEILVEKALRFWQGPVSLHVYPELHHPFLQQLENRYAIHLQLQSEGNLGKKLSTAMHRTLAEGRSVAVIGADAPHCTSTTLTMANQFLRSNQSVIAPSLDGGYYLIGLPRPCTAIFEAISWSSAHVRDQTLNQAKKCGIEFRELPALQDIDEWNDLVIAARELPALRHLIEKTYFPK